MRFLPPLFAASALLVASLNVGCAAEADRADDESSEDAIKTAFASPGNDLGRATTVVADVVGDAAFVVYDRTLERRTADGKVTSLGKIAPGFESLVVSKSHVAYLTSSFVSGGGSKVFVHVLSRAAGWNEVRTEDLSANPSVFHHPIAFVDDATLAVGSGHEIVLLAGTAPKASISGAAAKLGAGEVFSIYPAIDASGFFVALDNGDVLDVDAKTGASTKVPALESKGALTRLFDAKTKTWVTTDFEGIKVFGTNGKLVRKVDLETKKSRYIASRALLKDGDLLVTYQTESSQERSVLARYDLASMKPTVIGTFDGTIDQLGLSGDHVLFAFSPSGAAGFNSRVWYAHALGL